MIKGLDTKSSEEGGGGGLRMGKIDNLQLFYLLTNIHISIKSSFLVIPNIFNNY